MMNSTIGKGVLLFLMLMASFAVNVDDNLVTRLGLEMNYGMVLAAALFLSVLASGQRLGLILIIGLLSLIANMPDGFVLNFGIDRDVFFGLMAALILAPVVSWVFDA